MSTPAMIQQNVSSSTLRRLVVHHPVAIFLIMAYTVSMTIAFVRLRTSGDIQSPIQAEALEIVNAFHSVINSDNVDAALALFTDDATVMDSGSVFQGRDEIRKWVLYSKRVAGEKIFWNDMAHNGPELQYSPYILPWMAVIQKGKIKSLMVSLLPMPDGK